MSVQAPSSDHCFSTSLPHKPGVHLLFIALVALLAYSNTFNASFHFDDSRNIVANTLIRDFSSFIDPSTAREHPFYGELRLRPVGLFTFALNYKLHGLDVTGFHVLNLLIHMGNGFLVYFFVLTTFKTPKMQAPAADGPAHGDAQPDYRRYIAFFAALLFVSHPIQTQAVTYIVQRFTSLCTMFYLAALTAYAWSRLSQLRHRRVFGWTLHVLALAFTVLAMKTKEISFILPFALLLYELMFFGGTSESPRRRFGPLLPFVLTFAVIPLSAIDLGDESRPVLSQLAERSTILTSMSRKDYFLTQLTVIPVYMRLIFFPTGQNLDHDHPVYTELLDARVILSSLSILFVLLIGIWSLRLSRREDRRWRLVAFGIFWFFLTLLPESSIIPIVDVIFDHRVYPPSVGAFLAIASGVLLLEAKLRAKRPRARKVLLLVFSGVVLALSMATFARNAVWRDEVTLWEDVVRKSPHKARARNTLGSAYLDTGRLDRAFEELHKTLEIDPRYWAAHVNLGTCWMMAARAVFQETGSADRALDPVEKAIASYRYALDLNPGNAMVLSLLEAARERRSFLTMKRGK